MWQRCCFPVTFLPGQPRCQGAVGEGWLRPKRAELISAGVPCTQFVVWGAANHPQTLGTTADSCRLLEGGLLCEKGGSEMRQPPPHPFPTLLSPSSAGRGAPRGERKRRDGGERGIKAGWPRSERGEPARYGKKLQERGYRGD